VSSRIRPQQCERERRRRKGQIKQAAGLEWKEELHEEAEVCEDNVLTEVCLLGQTIRRRRSTVLRVERRCTWYLR